MLELEKNMRPYRHLIRSAAFLAAMGVILPGCDSALEPFVGKSKEAAARDLPQAPPPGPAPTTAFVSDSMLVPGYTGRTILPPTLDVPDTDDSSTDDTSAGSNVPRHAIAAVPLSADMGSLIGLSAAVKREADPADARFVLLVLSPPANDAAALDRANTAARQAASAAVKLLGDSGVAADRIEVSMATSPNAGVGELRLYRR